MRLSEENEQHVLVAGGAGFIGSNLVRKLLAEGAKIDCIDNLLTGRESAISPFVGSRQFRFFRGDITDQDFMSKISGNKYSQIYNLACPTGVPNIALLGEQMLLTSSIGSLNLLRMAKTHGSKYLFASTAEVYGNPEVVPQPETYTGNVDPIGPRSAYEEAKRFGEALTMQHVQSYGLDARIVRIFNTYGPNMSPDDTRVIPQMLSRMALRKPVTIFGDGSNTRTFLYVTDLLEGFALVMAQKLSGDVFNIGGEREMTINELFDACRKATRSKSLADYQPHFIEDHRRRLPDTSRIRALGWKPKIQIERGLSMSYRDVRDRALTASRGIERSVKAAGRPSGQPVTGGMRIAG